ncbi:MAG: alpha/beta fold hydrolase [Gemmatimonadaceae bacterium]
MAPEQMYPAGVAGMATRYLTLDSGIRVRVLEGGAPDGPAVLLVHGWGGCSYSFAEMIPALVHAGYRLVALELPGHGLSDKPVEESWYSEASLTRVVVEVAERERLARFAYVGHSMGGLLGLTLAVSGSMPAMRRLVLISSAGLSRIAVLPPIRFLSPSPVNRFVPAMLTRAVIAGVLRAAFGTKERPTQLDIDQYWALTQWDAYAWACRACLHHVDFSRVSAVKLRSLRMPVLVITGGRDRVVGGKAASRRSRLIPTARQVHLREGGHLVMQELAARTNPEILAFLSGLREE